MRDLSKIEAGAEGLPEPWDWIDGDGSHVIRLSDRARTGVYPPQHLIEWSHDLTYDPRAPDDDPENRQLDEAERIVEFIAAARSDVPALCAQVRSDDALLLELEWISEEGATNYAFCPSCGCCKSHGHAANCDMGPRCDEARARRVPR
jgi:hypothetical protein